MIFVMLNYVSDSSLERLQKMLLFISYIDDIAVVVDDLTWGPLLVKFPMTLLVRNLLLMVDVRYNNLHLQTPPSTNQVPAAGSAGGK